MMNIYYTDGAGLFYQGDMRPGDRETTTEEVQARQAEIISQVLTSSIQSHLDTFAQTRGYDDIRSAVSYAVSATRKFRTEGQYAADARDATWAKGYEILDEIANGQRPMPELDDIPVILAELPELNWPG